MKKVFRYVLSATLAMGLMGVGSAQARCAEAEALG